MNKRSGFTLIEILIVVGITALLSSISIGYSAGGRERITLQLERAKLLQVVLRAKSMSISTYNNPDVPCGFGVHMDKTTKKYFIFRYTSDPCPSPLSGVITIGSGDREGQEFNLPKNAVFSDDSVDTIFFIPPDPKTLIWRGENVVTSGQVILKNANDSFTVKVNSAGQVTF